MFGFGLLGLKVQLVSIKCGSVSAGILPLNLSARMQFDVTVTVGHIHRAKIIAHRMSGEAMRHVRVTRSAARITVILMIGWRPAIKSVVLTGQPSVLGVVPDVGEGKTSVEKLLNRRGTHQQ